MKNFKNVNVESVFKDLKTNYVYTLVLNYKEDESLPFSTESKITMQGSSVAEKFINVLTGKSKKEYLAHGMCDIDFDALPDGRIRIMESPCDGVRDYYELNVDSCKTLLRIFEKELQETKLTV